MGHPHYGVVNRGIPVRVVFTNHIPDHSGRLHVGPVVGIVQLIHGEEHTFMHWLQAIANVGQSPPNDDAHGVIEVGLPQLVLNIYWVNILGIWRGNF